MVEDNIKDFTINWIITGLLMTCLVSFAVVFMLNNNPNGLEADTLNKLGNTSSNLTNKLIHAPTTMLKDASANGRLDVIQVAQELFDLSNDDIDKSEF